MKISDEVLDEYKEVLAVFANDTFVGFGDERDFIKQAIRVFDDEEREGQGQTIESVSKKMDRSPIVEYFSIPDWNKETAELADFLFLVYHFKAGQIVDRYTMLSQAKYSDEDTDPEWEVKKHQYHLLEYMPVFKLDSPSRGWKHWISPDRNSCTNFVFAGECWSPFFQLTEKMKEEMGYSYYDTNDRTYSSESEPAVLNRMDVFLNRLIRGQLGESIDPDDDLYEFYERMFDASSAWPWSSSDNKITDGGAREAPPPEPQYTDDEEPGMAVIQIVVRDSNTPQLSELKVGDRLLISE
jgi:hypothetical protein